MQILHRFAGSIQRYSEELSDPDRYRPDHCPRCEAHRPLRAHGFYTRTLWMLRLMTRSAFGDTCAAVANARCPCCRSSPCRICASGSWASLSFWPHGFSSASCTKGTGGPNRRGVVMKTAQRPHAKRRGWLKNGNPPGDFSKAPRCGAKTRRGSPCRCPAMKNGRCRLHGGLSTGPRTAEGIERIRRAVTKHGRYTAAAKAERRRFRLFVKHARETIRELAAAQHEVFQKLAQRETKRQTST
jgi:hypothetical protein